MSDYLIWAAEKLEQKYNWDFDNAMEFMMTTDHIPYDLSLEKYIEENNL